MRLATLVAGRPVDTDIPDIMSAGLNLGTWTEYSKLAGTVPRLAVVSGRCFAGSAAIAGASDVVIATKDSTIGEKNSRDLNV